MNAFGVRGFALISALFLFFHVADGAQALYSVNADWSGTQNPSGTWSYNYNDAVITEYQTFWWGQPGWGYNWLGDGGILKGPALSSGTDPFGNPVTPPHDWQSNDVVLHALSIPYGGDTTFLNVKWASPASGRIDISGRAWDAQIASDRDVSWTLALNGETYAQRPSVRGLYRTNLEAQFEANLVGSHILTNVLVRQGDILEFRVVAQTYYGHFVGLELNIVPQQPFISSPVLSAAPYSLLSFSNLTSGGIYQLQRWVSWYWTNQPVTFTASDTFYTQLVAGVAVNSDYRLALSPVPSQAFAAAQVVNGFLVGATVTSAGSGYVTVPAVDIVGGGGSNATAVATITNGIVASLHITDAGIGYTNPPTIRIDPPPTASVPASSVNPLLRLDASGLEPSTSFQIQYQPDLNTPWANWPGSLLTPAQATQSQYLPMTNSSGFFRFQAVP